MSGPTWFILGILFGGACSMAGNWIGYRMNTRDQRKEP